MSKIFLRMYSRVARDPRLFAASQKFAWLGTRLVSPLGDYLRLPAFTGWGYSKDLPRFARKTFREKFNREDAKNAKVSFKAKRKEIKEEVSAPEVRKNGIDQFIEELTKVNGQVVRVSKGEVTGKVIEFLKLHDVDRIHLAPDVLEESALREAGITISHAPDAGIRVGVTKALCGVADTGSVLEVDGEGDRLQASLLPEIHIAVLYEADIYPSLEHAIHLARGTKSAVFITGPSRTGDIEMSLTIGVHGPGKLHVMIVSKQPPGG